MHVQVIDQDNMIYQDLSDWTTDPTVYSVEVTRPATSQPVSVEVSGTENTRISQEDIGTIVDGIYTFETVSCGIRYKRYKGLFFHTECCIKKTYIGADTRTKELLQQVQETLKETQAAIEVNNISLAEELYEIVEAQMDRIACDCGC